MNKTRRCKRCRKRFQLPQWRLNMGPGTFCGVKCSVKWRVKPVKKRFLAKVRKTKTCWLWVGAVTTKSRKRGVLKVDGKSMTAARVSWELFRGKIPKGKSVLHDCPGGDDPRCVNPSHLWLGTQLENITDRHRKGRDANGLTHPKAKLNPAKVRSIRRKRCDNKTDYAVLAVEFGVSESTVWSAGERKAWKHVK